MPQGLFQLPQSTILSQTVMCRKFRIWDDNRDHKLSKSEFLKGMLELGIPMVRDADIIEAFDMFDKDKSGQIDFNEFIVSIRVRTHKSILIHIYLQ